MGKIYDVISVRIEKHILSINNSYEEIEKCIINCKSNGKLYEIILDYDYSATKKKPLLVIKKVKRFLGISYFPKERTTINLGKYNKTEIVTTKKIEDNQINIKDDMNSLKIEFKTTNTDAGEKNVRNERKKFLQLLADKPELLESFSNDKLEVLLKEYKHSNEIKRMKIKRMKIKRYGGSV